MVAGLISLSPGPGPQSAGPAAHAGPSDLSKETLAPRSPEVSIRFFGVSTLVIDDDRTRLVVDGFFSRPGLPQTLFGRLTSNSEAIKAALGDDEAPEVSALLVAHAHHDHVLDMPAIVDRSEATVVLGTEAVRHLGLARGVAGPRMIVGQEGATYAFGDFTVEPLPVPHGPPLPIIGALLDREMGEPPTGPAHFTRFRDPDNLSFAVRHGDLTMLVHPSAGTRDLTSLGAEVVFLGMGRVGTMDPSVAEAYFAGVIGPSTRIVVPIHWDAFTTAAGMPLRPTPWPFDNVSVGLRRLCHFLEARPAIRVLLPDWGSSVVVDPRADALLSGTWTQPCA